MKAKPWWRLTAPHEKALVHTQGQRLVVVVLDSRGCWGSGPEAEATVRADLEKTGLWRTWDDVRFARQAFEQRFRGLFVQLLERDRQRQGPEACESALSVLMVVANGAQVSVVQAGLYNAIWMRDRSLIKRTEKPTDPLPTPPDAALVHGRRKATALDLVHTDRVYCPTKWTEPMPVLPRWEVQRGDELVVAERLFFKGFHTGPPGIGHAQSSALDWSAVSGRRHVEVLRVSFDGPTGGR